VHDVRVGGFVIFEFEFVECGFVCLDEGDVIVGDDVFFDGCFRVAYGVFDVVFAFFEFDFGGCVCFDDGDVVGEFGEVFLEFLVVVVGV